MRLALALALLWSSTAFAQQSSPDPVTLQRLLAAVEQQRNQALTAQAIAEAKIGGLSDELIKVNTRLKELEGKGTADGK